MKHAADPSAVIDLLDAGVLAVRKHRVIRALYAAIPHPTAEQAAVMAAADAGLQGEAERWLTWIWAQIEALPSARQGELRLLVGLLHGDEALGGHEAEYLIDWASEQGVSDDQIVRAFQPSASLPRRLGDG